LFKVVPIAGKWIAFVKETKYSSWGGIDATTSKYINHWYTADSIEQACQVDTKDMAEDLIILWQQKKIEAENSAYNLIEKAIND